MKTLVLAVLLVAPLALADELVSQKDKAFAPGDVTVKAGQRVTFVNNDTVAHNVFSKDAKFNLKIQPPGDKQSVSFDTPGTYEVRCAIHPKMTLKVKVVAP